MIKKIAAAAASLGLLLSAGPVWALPTFVSSNVVPSGQSVAIPENAAQVAPNIFSLGTAVDPQTGKVVEGFAVAHPKKGYHHRPGHSGGKGGNGTTSTKCYSFLANGAKWKAVEPWVVNTSNNADLDGAFVFETLSSSIGKWEIAAEADILGDSSTTTGTLVADTASPDGQNEVYFADVSSSGAIAVTIVWGIFSGPPWARELVEWDQIYDDVDFSWSSNGEAGKMDFENIATHELGHSVGLGHPDDSCTQETMYRFASEGETKKRDLHTGDIAGVSELY